MRERRSGFFKVGELGMLQTYMGMVQHFRSLISWQSGSGPRVDSSFSTKCALQAALRPLYTSPFWGSAAGMIQTCESLLPFHLNGERKANSILQSSLYQYSLYVAFDLL